MTTSVTVDVNGRYVATVTQTTQPDQFTKVVTTSKVYGRYDGSPNESGQKQFWLPHDGSTFTIVEEQVPDAPAATS